MLIQIGDKCKGTFGDTWTVVRFRDDLNGRPGVDVSIEGPKGVENWTRWTSVQNFQRRVERYELENHAQTE